MGVALLAQATDASVEPPSWPQRIVLLVLFGGLFVVGVRAALRRMRRAQDDAPGAWWSGLGVVLFGSSMGSAMIWLLVAGVMPQWLAGAFFLGLVGSMVCMAVGEALKGLGRWRAKRDARAMGLPVKRWVVPWWALGTAWFLGSVPFELATLLPLAWLAETWQVPTGFAQQERLEASMRPIVMATILTWMAIGVALAGWRWRAGLRAERQYEADRRRFGMSDADPAPV